MDLHAGCLLDEKDAVPSLFFQFDAVRGEVCEPLPVGDVAEAVFARSQAYSGGPPAITLMAHGDGFGFPSREIAGNGDGLGVGAEEAELDLTVCPDACHGLTP